MAAALALEPDLLALDDPAAELDPEGADALYAMLPALAVAGAAILIATPHTDRRGARRHAGDALGGGRVVATGCRRRAADDCYGRGYRAGGASDARRACASLDGAMSGPRAPGLPVEWDGVTFRPTPARMPC